MPQKAIPSATLAAAVREYLGLSQEQLAAYLNVSWGQVAHVEAGRRQLGAEAGRLLRELAARMPLTGSATVPDATDGLAPPPPAAKALLRRLAVCCWQLANRQARLVQRENQVELAGAGGGWRPLRSRCRHLALERLRRGEASCCGNGLPSPAMRCNPRPRRSGSYWNCASGCWRRSALRWKECC